MIEVLKSDNHTGTLDGAISIAFPNASDIQKDGIIGYGFGTISVDGVDWDWILKSDRIRFFLAE